MTQGDPPPGDAELHLQALCYLNGELSEPQVIALRERLLADPQAAARFVQHVQVASLVRETVQRDEGVRKELSLPSDRDFNFDDVLASLTPPDDLPPIEIIEVMKGQHSVRPAPESQVTAAQAIHALGYLFKQSRSAILTTGAIAAALVLAAVLYAVFLAGHTEMETVQQDGAPTQAPALPAVVATLSDEDGATWQVASGGTTPSVGEELHAGQRLMLLSGTAQVTTRRGAIVNLQSPCTIELLAGGNAMSLLHGRVVGICETRSSKGLLIRTPQADITDLSTRFGVDATRDDLTEVHVFKGEVKVAVAHDQADQATRDSEQVFSAGQAVATGSLGVGLVAIPADADRFADIQATELTPVARATQIDGVRSIAGDLREASAASFTDQDPGNWPTGEDAFVFHDFVGRLNADAKANVVAPGTYNKLEQVQAATIASGTDLRSYIIFKPGNTDGSTTRVKGSITFENDVIGIITDEQTANAFVAAIRATSPVFTPGSGADRWIDLYTFNEGVSLSEDRRTVSFEFQVKGSADTIRVLVKTD